MKPMKTLSKSLVVEAALAGLFLAVAAAPALAHDHEKSAEGGEAPKAEAKSSKKTPPKAAATVHCLGVNSCKGTTECAVDGKNGCTGHNECKGQGWISLTKKECKKQKGTVQVAKKAESKTESAPAAK